MKHTLCSVPIKPTPIAGPAFTRNTPCVFVCVGCHRYALQFECRVALDMFGTHERLSVRTFVIILRVCSFMALWDISVCVCELI